MKFKGKPRSKQTKLYGSLDDFAQDLLRISRQALVAAVRGDLDQRRDGDERVVAEAAGLLVVGRRAGGVRGARGRAVPA